MKVFVATGSGNRRLSGGLVPAVDGELVWLEWNGPCAECGCCWSVTGLVTDQIAPVFRVVDRADLHVGEYARLMRDAWRRRGWPLSRCKQSQLESFARVHLDVAARFDEGEELSFRGGRLHRTVVPRPS
jgi:hypothetical protein